MQSWFDSLAPQDSDYALLSRSYLEFRQEASDGNNLAAIRPSVLHVGESDPRVAAIVRQLISGEYLLPERASGALVYTEAIAKAVKRPSSAFSW
jgi:murein L,D-transpeptidase YcbB/YkuD